MRNKWLMLIVCGLRLIAAGKSRDWQTGQVVESKALSDPRDHAIASADKTYLVRGSVGNGDQALAVGATVRFAVESKNMFLSSAGKEYRLYVLGVRSATANPAAPPSPPPSVAPVKPTAEQSPPPQGELPLDNDAVVKMIVGGLKEDTVLRVIEARPGKYTLTADALAALKAAGVPQGVITAMSAKMRTQGR